MYLTYNVSWRCGKRVISNPFSAEYQMNLFYCRFTGCFYFTEKSPGLKSLYSRQHNSRSPRPDLGTCLYWYERIVHEVNTWAGKRLFEYRMTAVDFGQSRTFMGTTTDDKYRKHADYINLPTPTASVSVNDHFCDLCASSFQSTCKAKTLFVNMFLKYYKWTVQLFQLSPLKSKRTMVY